MRPVTKERLVDDKACCSTAALQVAQCCSKSSKIISGCHD